MRLDEKIDKLMTEAIESILVWGSQLGIEREILNTSQLGIEKVKKAYSKLCDIPERIKKQKERLRDWENALKRYQQFIEKFKKDYFLISYVLRKVVQRKKEKLTELENAIKLYPRGYLIISLALRNIADIELRNIVPYSIKTKYYHLILFSSIFFLFLSVTYLLH